MRAILLVLILAVVAIIALVGDNMKQHQGLSGKMFSTLGRNNVNIRAIAQGASERNISAVIAKGDVKKALNALHEEFFEENIKQLNLFVMGVGNVGAKFLEQVRQQRKFLKDNLKLNIRIIGISNSRTMIFNGDGIALKNWDNLLAEGEKADKEAFFDKVQQLNYRNSIFVDNTASDAVASVDRPHDRRGRARRCRARPTPPRPARRCCRTRRSPARTAPVRPARTPRRRHPRAG